jgi:protein-L-isoaspartate(D-aspartate) O-methyltransferase
VTPHPLLEQLNPGARLVIPVGRHGEQVLQVWERQETGWDMEEIVPVAFVPLRGTLGWKDNEWDE